MSELDVPPWQQPETVPATPEWLDESPFAAGVGTAPLTESPFSAELGVTTETTGVTGELEVPSCGQVPAGPESGLEVADIGSPGETGKTCELHYPEHLFGTQGPAESEDPFEAEEFARHALYQTSSDEALGTEALAAMELPARPATARARILTTSQLRNDWRAYECAEHRMVRLRLFGRWNTPVNPVTVDAWRALERALAATGYQAHRAWVYNCRDIHGQHTRSLHAYGLAIDIDDSRPICNVNRATPDRREVRFSPAPTKEERCADVRAGIADTSFTPTQVAAVEAIRTVDGHQVFAWGGHWHTTKDTMHFQINVTPGELTRGIQPATVEGQLAELPGELGTVPYEALDGFEPELDAPGWGEPAHENQTADVSNRYGNTEVSTGGFGSESAPRPVSALPDPGVPPCACGEFGRPPGGSARTYERDLTGTPVELQVQQAIPAAPGSHAMVAVFGQKPEGYLFVPVADMVAGIDVSRHQGRIDWVQVAAAGTGFAYIKATEGATGPHSRDGFFRTNWAGALANGIPRGAYHLLTRPRLSSARDQARNFLNHVALQAGDLPPALDVETRTVNLMIQDVGVPSVWRHIWEWCEIVHAATGYQPLLYMGKGGIDALSPHVESLPALDLWMPHYRPIHRLPPLPADAAGNLIFPHWTFWQHSERGNVRGIRGHVDLDLFNGNPRNFSQWIASVQHHDL